MLAEALGTRRQVVQYHWGGGTPTYLSLAQIAALQAVVSRHFDIQTGAEVAIEVDPRVTSVEQLALLRDLGFNRLSLGVQDFTPEVQAGHQPHSVRAAHADAVRRGARPRLRVDQHRSDLRAAAADARVVRQHGRRRRGDAARPGRRLLLRARAVDSRAPEAHLNPADLPPAERKIELFVEAMERFRAAGYAQIGMDHFALPTDELRGRLRRGPAASQLHGLHDAPGARHAGGRRVRHRRRRRGVRAEHQEAVRRTTRRSTRGRFPIERGYRLERDDHLRRLRHHESDVQLPRRSARRGPARFSIEFADYFAGELVGARRRAPSRDGFVSV